MELTFATALHIRKVRHLENIDPLSNILLAMS